MRIKYIEAKPVNGGFTRLNIVVDRNIKDVYKTVSEAVSKPYNCILEPVKEKRTLTANAYYWVLVDKLKAVLRTDTRSLHRELLARYGETATDSQGTPILFRMAQDIKPSELGNIYIDAIGTQDGYVTYRVLKGSHEMTKQEFARLLDGLISECKEADIEVLPDEELKRLYEISQS